MGGCPLLSFRLLLGQGQNPLGCGWPLFLVPASQTFQGTQGLRDPELDPSWDKTPSPGQRGSKLLHSSVPTTRCPTPSQFKIYFVSTCYVLGGFSTSVAFLSPGALVPISPPHWYFPLIPNKNSSGIC